MKNIGKKLTFTILLAVSALVLVACGGKGPDKTAESFLEAYKVIDVKEMTKYVSEDIIESLEEESEDIDDILNEEMKKSLGRYTSELKYEIKDIVMNEDESEAILDVDFIYADGGKAIANSMGEVLGELMGLAFSEEEPTDEEVNDVLSSILIRNLDENEITKENKSGTITLNKNDGGWIITEMDDNVLNVLTIGIVDGLNNWNPLENLEPEDGESEIDIEVDVDSVE